MDIHEIQIDDYVMFDGSVYQIEEISKKGWVHLTHDGNRLSLTSDYILDYLKGVPLTQEILEKNGFVHKHIDEPMKRQYWILRYAGGQVKVKFNWNRFYFEITGVPKFVGYYCPKFSSHLDYVHQLQHALRICGIEKEILI